MSEILLQKQRTVIDIIQQTQATAVIITKIKLTKLSNHITKGSQVNMVVILNSNTQKLNIFKTSLKY